MTAGQRGSSGEDTLVRPTYHLFLSPHYDDIALSVGGSVAKLSDAGRRVEEAIFFAAEPDPDAELTPFAAAMHAGWGLGREAVIAGRRREEAAAAALLGMGVRLLPFQDAIYRGERYLDNVGLFGPVAADEADVPGRIVEALALSERPDRARRLYAPLAIGGHVDHQLAFATGIELARVGHDVWFYEDLPYALEPAHREARAAALAAAGIPLAIAAAVDVTGVWERKLAAILSYSSQLATVFADGQGREAVDQSLRRYADEIGGGIARERFWRLVPPEPGFPTAYLGSPRGRRVGTPGPGSGPSWSPARSLARGRTLGPVIPTAPASSAAGCRATSTPGAALRRRKTRVPKSVDTGSMPC